MDQKELETGLEFTPPKMPLKHKIFIAGGVLAALCIIAAAAFLTGLAKGSEEPPPPTITSSMLGEQIRSIQELAVVAYYYTNMGRFEHQADFYGWKVPFTTKSFIVSYDGIIRAGVALEETDVQVNEEAGTITVTLPPSKILSHEIPEDSLEVFDERDNIFNPITLDDYAGFTQDQKTKMEQRAVENGLLQSADEKARTAVESFLLLLPGMELYTLTVQ